MRFMMLFLMFLSTSNALALEGWQDHAIGGYYGTVKNAGYCCQPTGIGGIDCI